MVLRLWRLRSSSTEGPSGFKRGESGGEIEIEAEGVGLRGDEMRGVYGEIRVLVGIALMSLG